MDALANLLWHEGKFLGIEWHLWKVIGWVGNFVFTARFAVQWYVTERKKQVVVPVSFWWLSLIGSLLLLAFAVFSAKNSVFIFAYAFNWIPYVRNLIIHHRHQNAHITCSTCSIECPPKSKFCMNCGTPLETDKSAK
ncbi:MAG: lipid-A-disaccharide synthase N-terminal domain-containing protein [Verrucomicrobia bacterium]|nr:lipid-A-disaccharide synthase N-terminal domain-containing protein [Verrucomicrobiota bacterium]